MKLSDSDMKFGDIILNAYFVLSVRSGILKQLIRILIAAYLRAELPSSSAAPGKHPVSIFACYCKYSAKHGKLQILRSGLVY